MTTTDLAAGRRAVDRKEPAVVLQHATVQRRQPRHPAVQAIGFLIAFVGILLFLGYTLALLTT